MMPDDSLDILLHCLADGCTDEDTAAFSGETNITIIRFRLLLNSAATLLADEAREEVNRLRRMKYRAVRYGTPLSKGT